MLTSKNTLLLVIDFQERLMPLIYRHEEMTKKAEILIKGCRILDVPILITQQYTKGLGETIKTLKDALGDHEVIEKISFSCCGSDEFIDAVRKSGKKNIIVTGIEAHICVLQTVLELLDFGADVYVIADCISSRSDADRLYAERRMDISGAILTTVESALFEILGRADHPKRKEISNLVK